MSRWDRIGRHEGSSGCKSEWKHVGCAGLPWFQHVFWCLCLPSDSSLPRELRLACICPKSSPWGRHSAESKTKKRVFQVVGLVTARRPWSVTVEGDSTTRESESFGRVRVIREATTCGEPPGDCSAVCHTRCGDGPSQILHLPIAFQGLTDLCSSCVETEGRGEGYNNCRGGLWRGFAEPEFT